MQAGCDMLIIGGGPGGYAAALYAARSGLETLVLEKLSAGGQMALSEQIDNYPGFDEGIDGFSLGERMRRGAERFGARTLLAEVTGAALAGTNKTVITSAGAFTAKAVVIATGARPRNLGIPGESAFEGRGAHYCAACDGMAAALTLSRIAGKVFLVHRRDTLRATKVYHEPLARAGNVEFRWNSEAAAFLGNDKLTGLLLRDVLTGKTRELPCDAVFVSVGRAPETELFREQLALDAAGYIIADESTQTSLPGVFAVGDVRTKALRQIVTAVADGATAVHYAEEYLAKLG